MTTNTTPSTTAPAGHIDSETKPRTRKLLTHAELARLRSDPEGCAQRLAREPELLDLVLRQAAHALDCAALLDELEHYPAKPYGEGAALVAHITDACNDLWNRYHYGS